MKYAIEIIKGSLLGKRFDLEPGKALSIGRAPSNSIQLEEADVSRRHVSIMADKYGTCIILEVFSSRKTFVDGREVSLGEKIELSTDSIVQLGRDIQFRLERKQEDEGDSNLTAVSADEETVIFEEDSLESQKHDGQKQTPVYEFARIANVSRTTEKNEAASSFPVERGASSLADEPTNLIEASSSPSNAPQSWAKQAGAPTNLVDAPSRQTTVQQPMQPQSSSMARSSAMADEKTSQESEFRQHTEMSGEATDALQTRMASTEEIDVMKRVYRSQHRRKLSFWVFSAVAFFALTVFFYFILRPKKEEIVTWPTDSNGKELLESVQTATYLGTLVPKIEGIQTQGKVTQKNDAGDPLYLLIEEGSVDVYTHIGKLRDVQLHIVISTQKDKDGLKKDRSQAFSDWIASMHQKYPEINFDGSGRIEFVNVTQGSGVPITVESYDNRVGNDNFFGVVAYFRHADNVHWVMAEVPSSEKWRCEELLRKRLLTKFALYAIRLTSDWWEGSSRFRAESTIEEDVKEAEDYLRRKNPAYWEKIHYLSKSALIKASLTEDTAVRDQALEALKSLRVAQATWYNARKLEYQQAFRNGDKETMRSIQSTCESIFSAEFQEDDYRYEYIRRKNWQ